MKGYWLILGTEITDQVAQDEYNRLWAPIAEKYQVRLNPTKVPPLLKESTRHRARYHCRVSLLRDGQSLLRGSGLSGSPAVRIAGLAA
jgi:hypothetical protein